MFVWTFPETGPFKVWLYSFGASVVSTTTLWVFQSKANPLEQQNRLQMRTSLAFPGYRCALSP